MERTILMITYFVGKASHIMIVVSENIRIVYTTLKEEGVSMEIRELNPVAGSERCVELHEIDEKAEKLGKLEYNLMVDLNNSFINTKKFNSLLEFWVILDIEG